MNAGSSFARIKTYRWQCAAVLWSVRSWIRSDSMIREAPCKTKLSVPVHHKLLLAFAGSTIKVPCSQRGRISNHPGKSHRSPCWNTTSHCRCRWKTWATPHREDRKRFCSSREIPFRQNACGSYHRRDCSPLLLIRNE